MISALTKEKKKASRRRYYLAHREEEKKCQKDHYWGDPEKYRRIADTYRKTNSEKYNEIKKRSKLKNKNGTRIYNGRYYQDHAELIKRQAVYRFRKRVYGLTPEGIEEILKVQKNKCGICGFTFENTPNIDHCHKNPGKVRGLLCSQCNCGLGFFDENPAWISNAIKWLLSQLPTAKAVGL